MVLLLIRLLAGPAKRVGTNFSLILDAKTFPKYCISLQIFALIIPFVLK